MNLFAAKEPAKATYVRESYNENPYAKRKNERQGRSRTTKIELLAAPSVTAGSFKPKKLTALGYGRRNGTVQRIRAAADPRVVKQPGRRYGPPPLSGNDNLGSPVPKGRRTAALAEKHARAEITS